MVPPHLSPCVTTIQVQKKKKEETERKIPCVPPSDSPQREEVTEAVEHVVDDARLTKGRGYTLEESVVVFKSSLLLPGEAGNPFVAVVFLVFDSASSSIQEALLFRSPPPPPQATIDTCECAPNRTCDTCFPPPLLLFPHLPTRRLYRYRLCPIRT